MAIEYTAIAPSPIIRHAQGHLPGPSNAARICERLTAQSLFGSSGDEGPQLRERLEVQGRASNACRHFVGFTELPHGNLSSGTTLVAHPSMRGAHATY